MIVLLVAAAAACAGGGIVLITWGLVGTATSLDGAVAELHRPRHPAAYRTAGPAWLERLAGRPTGRRLSDLTVCERDTARWVQDRLKWASLIAALAMLAAAVVPVAAGYGTALPVVVAALVAGGLAGWLYAGIDLRSDAERARRDVRHAVASYLELVTILMAGGSGPESAMYLAAEVGRGPAFRHLRSALAAAQVRQEPPWAFLGQLGTRLAVPQLVELGASMTLAGGGAQVKDTLSAKAASIRVADLARVESEAQARSETMAFPVVMMFTGFLLLLGYPALAGLTGP